MLLSRAASRLHGGNSTLTGSPPATPKRKPNLSASGYHPPPSLPSGRGHHLAPSDAHHILNHEDLLKVLWALTAGSAVDALGWSHEAWQTVYHAPRGQQLLREILVLYATGETGREATDLINCCLAIPLRKDATGEGLRPIAIPSAFRKVYARVFVAKFCPQLREAAGPHQFAAMTRDGARSILLVP